MAENMTVTPSVQVENPVGAMKEALPSQAQEVGPMENIRLLNDWKKTVGLVFAQNKDRLGRDKLTPQKIAEAQVCDPEEIVKETAFQGLSADDEKVKTEALLRRQVVAFDILFAVEDCRNAAEVEIEKRASKELDAKKTAAKDKALRLANDQAKAKDLNAAEITTLSAEEQEKIDKMTLSKEEMQAIADEVIPLFYDKKTKTFNRVVKQSDGTYVFDKNPDGSQKTVCETQAYQAVFEGAQAIAQATDEHGRPTPEAQIAKRILKTLKISEDGKSFLLYSKEQARHNESFGIFLDASATLEALLDPKKEFFLYNDNGEVIGVKQEALAKLESDDRLARLAIYVADFYQEEQKHPGTTTEGQHNLATLMLLELQGIDVSQIPEDRFPGLRTRLETLAKNEDMKTRVALLKQDLIENWLAPAGVNIEDLDVAVQTIFRALELEKIAQQDPQKAEEFLNEISANEADRNSIIRLSKGTADRTLSKFFGLDLDTLTSKDYAEIYAKRATAALDAASQERGLPPFSKEKKSSFWQLLENLITIKDMEKFFEKHPHLARLKKMDKYNLLGFLVFAQAIQGLLSIGVEPAQEGPGGH